jgi:hypothetical protein
MKARRLQPEPEREYRISGTYKTTRDEGLDYAYSAIWRSIPSASNGARKSRAAEKSSAGRGASSGMTTWTMRPTCIA